MKRIVIGISGASGAMYGIRILEVLKKINDFETHLIISNAAAITIREETSLTVHEVEDMADVVYDISDVGANIASAAPENIETMTSRKEDHIAICLEKNVQFSKGRTEKGHVAGWRQKYRRIEESADSSACKTILTLQPVGPSVANYRIDF